MQSRRRSGKKRDLSDPLADFPMSLMGELSDIGSDGWPGIMALKNRSSDSVKSMYIQFKVGGGGGVGGGVRRGTGCLCWWEEASATIKPVSLPCTRL